MGSLAGQTMLVEPFIAGFRKFNSNSGAADLSAEVAQALSHYSYHASDGSELLCDLQGGKAGESYILSDVVILSKAKKYGATDLGVTGIENWLHAHRCNQFCSAGWKSWKGARKHIEPVFSTILTLDTRTAPAIEQEFVDVRPCTIRFTQNSIKDRFHDGQTILDTAISIARQDLKGRNIRMITAVRWEGCLFSLDNRRLAVFRLLEMCGKVNTIKVEIIGYDAVEEDWERKVTTTNRGVMIDIRGSKHTIGTKLLTTNYPGISQIQDATPSYVQPDDQFSVTLASFTDD